MNDPDKSDDDWAELARELDRDTRSATPLRTEDEPQEFVAGVSESDDSPPEEFEDAEAAEGAADEADGGTEEGEAGADGQPGTGRKRRRRRRRRRKGGADQPAEAAKGGETEAAEAEGEAETEPAAEAMDEDAGYEELVPAGSDVESNEDASGELLRELIANWNVPSWDDIVSGLYRPER